MSCITSGYNLSCAGLKAAGGINRIWLINIEDIASATVTSGEVTALTLAALASAYEIQFLEDTASFAEPTNVANNNVSYTQTLTMVIPKRNLALRNFINNLGQCSCGFAVVWEEATGERWIGGLQVSGTTPTKRRTFKIAAGDGGVTGTAITDANQETIVFATTSVEKAYALDSAVVIPGIS